MTLATIHPRRLDTASGTFHSAPQYIGNMESTIKTKRTEPLLRILRKVARAAAVSGSFEKKRPKKSFKTSQKRAPDAYVIVLGHRGYDCV